MPLSTVLLHYFKNKLAAIAAVVATTVLASACNSSDDGSASRSLDSSNSVETSGEIGDTLVNDGTWTLDDKLFVGGGENLRTQSNQVDHVIIVVGDEVFDNSNGVYSGGSIKIILSLTGNGVYSVSDIANTQAMFGSGAKVASITVTAGTLSNNPTQWATTTSGTVTVNVNQQGRYFVSTTQPLILTRKLDIGTGIPGSPDQITFNMRTINGVLIQ